MKKRIALVLCLVLVAGVMVGCGKADTVVGAWETELDMSRLLAQSLGGEGEELEKYFDFSGLTMKLELTFDEDGTYVMQADEASASAMFTKLVDVMAAGMGDYMVASFKAQGTEFTVKDIEDMMGGSIEEMVKELFTEESLDDLLDDMETEGEYEYEDGVLTMDGEECDCRLKGNKMTLDMESDEMEAMFPMEFKRIK